MNIPAYLQHLPVDEGTGLPVPFTSLIDGEGVVHAQSADIQKWMICARQNRCTLCGKILGYWIYFIGTEKNLKKRLLPNPPMHLECAQFALDHLMPEDTPNEVLLLKTRSPVEISIQNGIAIKSPPFKEITKVKRGSTDVKSSGIE